MMLTGNQVLERHNNAIQDYYRREKERQQAWEQKAMEDARRHAFEREVHTCLPTPEMIRQAEAITQALIADYKISSKLGRLTD